MKVNVLLSTTSWRDCLSVRDARGRTVMDKLIEKLPEAAKVQVLRQIFL